MDGVLVDFERGYAELTNTKPAKSFNGKAEFWEPISKAEVVYTIGTFSGAGVVIGYFNIEDK